MRIDSAGALVSGGASGLGEATVRRLHDAGAHVVIADLNREKGEALAADLGEWASFRAVDVTDPDAVEAAAAAAAMAPRGLRIAVGCAGIGWAQRVTGRQGPHPLDLFRNVVEVNLVGMFNLMRLATTRMNANEVDEEGERGLFVSTASVAAFDGQIGQIAYAASKAGIVGMTLPAARDLAGRGIRVMTIAPGLFDTPLLAALPEEARTALGESIPFPSRLGRPGEFADLVAAIAGNPMLNGETVRLDGAIRMPPR